MAITVTEVALAAGVSATTVSLCFQEESRISSQTRARVLKAARELGYVPNQFARRLRSGKSHMIALLVSEMHSPSIIEIISGVERTGIENGYNVLVFNTFRDIDIEQRVIESACELKVEGIIVMASEEANPRLQQLCDDRFPLVYLNSLPPSAAVSHIIYDMEAIGRLGMDYLLKLGHRRILLINSEERSKTFSSFARIEMAYRNVLEERGIAVDFKLIRYHGTTIADGYAGVQSALEDDTPFSAVFAICDEVALGVIERLEKCGKKVPDDVSVLGIDNINVSGLSRIGLSTIEIHSTSDEKNLGVMAAKALLRAIELGVGAPTESILLKPRLVQRQSCREYRG